MNLKLKAAVDRMLARFGYELRRMSPGRPNPIHPWADDAGFQALMREVSGYTLVDPVRCFILYQLTAHVAGLRGDVAEIGVYKGGTARLLARLLARQGKTVHLFDTFRGMPAVDPKRDHHKAGDFGDTSCAAVARYLRDCPNVRLYPGVFPETAGPIEGRSFCLVHVDTDIYPSVRDCCAFFYPRLVPGGVLVFDDYGFVSCPGAKLAVDEFFRETAEKPCYLPTGQCLVVRHAPRAAEATERLEAVAERGA